MKIGLFSISILAVISTGCATVDLQSMAGTSDAAASDAVVPTNVVQRSVNQLRAAFSSRGFGEKTSQRKMQAATNILLNGLSAQSMSASDEGYAAQGKTKATILADIRMARSHVDQTTRAAEVYLALVQPDHDLNEELASLQSALLASDRASRLFETSLPDNDTVDLERYREAVDALRIVTNAFGEKVRMSKSGKLALQDA